MIKLVDSKPIKKELNFAKHIEQMEKSDGYAVITKSNGTYTMHRMRLNTQETIYSAELLKQDAFQDISIEEIKDE